MPIRGGPQLIGSENNKWHSHDPLGRRLRGRWAPPLAAVWKQHAWSVDRQTLERQRELRIGIAGVWKWRFQCRNGSSLIPTVALTGMHGDRQACGPYHNIDNMMDNRSCFRVVLTPSQYMTAGHNHTSLSEVTDAAALGAWRGPVDKADRLLLTQGVVHLLSNHSVRHQCFRGYNGDVFRLTVDIQQG